MPVWRGWALNLFIRGGARSLFIRGAAARTSYNFVRRGLVIIMCGGDSLYCLFLKELTGEELCKN